LKIDQSKMIDFKAQVVKKLTSGLSQLASARKVKIVHGVAKFTSDHQLLVENDKETHVIGFDHCVIAAGSEPVKLPFLPQDERIIDSTGALELKKIGGKMLIIGGGIIGCEMATVYQALGTDVTVVEMTDQIMPGAQKDIVRPCQQLMQKRGVEFMLNTKVVAVSASAKGLAVTFEGGQATESRLFDQILVSVGRGPNGHKLQAHAAGIKVDDRGFIPTDKQLRTNVNHIFAIGDITHGPMLAHKATAEGRLVAEVIAGKRIKMDVRCIPSVAYTDPEVAWVGQSRDELKAAGIDFKEGVFPWIANGRSLCLGRSEGRTVLYADAVTGRVLGGAVVGKNAGDIIGVIGFAIEMGADVHDLAMTVFAHPTLVETVGQAAEVLLGEPVDVLPG
jgi:dihydrolipoamide dehydrogenase